MNIDMNGYIGICMGEIAQAKAIVAFAKQILRERQSATARRALARGIIECAQVIAEFNSAPPIPPAPRRGPGQPMDNP